MGRGGVRRGYFTRGEHRLLRALDIKRPAALWVLAECVAAVVVCGEGEKGRQAQDRTGQDREGTAVSVSARTAGPSCHSPFDIASQNTGLDITASEKYSSLRAAHAHGELSQSESEEMDYWRRGMHLQYSNR